MTALRFLTLALVMLLAFPAAPAKALGINNGLDALDLQLSAARQSDSDPAHQAAIDKARAILADPKITTVEKEIKAAAAALKTVVKSYGTIEAFALESGATRAQILNPFIIAVAPLASDAAQAALPYLGTSKQIPVALALARLNTAYSKGQTQIGSAEFQKGLTTLAKVSKAFVGFARKYGK